MSKIEHFPFYINYLDVDDYYVWLLDTYGEKAKCIALIDKNYDRRISNPDVNADVLLFEIRQFLVDNGCEKEVAACDTAFANTWRKKRGKKNPYVPMSERWKIDDAAMKEQYGEADSIRFKIQSIKNTKT